MPLSSSPQRPFSAPSADTCGCDLYMKICCSGGACSRPRKGISRGHKSFPGGEGHEGNGGVTRWQFSYVILMRYETLHYLYVNVPFHSFISYLPFTPSCPVLYYAMMTRWTSCYTHKTQQQQEVDQQPEEEQYQTVASNFAKRLSQHMLLPVTINISSLLLNLVVSSPVRRWCPSSRLLVMSPFYCCCIRVTFYPSYTGVLSRCMHIVANNRNGFRWTIFCSCVCRRVFIVITTWLIVVGFRASKIKLFNS